MHDSISIRQSIGPSVSVHRFVGHTVNINVNIINASREESQLSSNLVIMQSFHHHEDASLALWAFLLLFLFPIGFLFHFTLARATVA